ncbi:MAG: hypothetical protein R2713_20870 [Ilumatobacteraceae bacterium]
MDLKLSSHTPTDAEVGAIESVLGPTRSSWHGGDRTGAEQHGDHHVARGGHDLRTQQHRLLPTCCTP